MESSHDLIEFLKFNKIKHHDFYSLSRIDLSVSKWDLTVECHVSEWDLTVECHDDDIFELYGNEMNTGEEIYPIFLGLKDLILLLGNV